MTRPRALILVAALTVAGCGAGEPTPITGFESRHELRGTVIGVDETVRRLDISVDGTTQPLNYAERTQLVDSSGARRSIRSLASGTPVQVMVRPNETGALVIETLTILPSPSLAAPSVIEPPESD